MMVSKLPEIMLTCRNGHDFLTRARGGATVRCKECGAPKHVPQDRPRTERAARDQAEHDGPAGTPAGGSELAGRWAREPAWNDRAVILPGRSGDDCPECGDPLQWEPGRTLVYCESCKRVTLPAAVAAHYQRHDQTRAEVATRAAPDESAERAARVQLRALAQRMSERVAEWVDAFDPDGLNGNAERLALDYQAELAAYLPEIKQAKSQPELADIMAEVTEVTDRAQRFGVLAEIERQREAIERQAAQADREAEWEAEQAQLAAQAEQAERQAEIEARAERRAIASRAESRPVPVVAGSVGYQGGNGYVSVGVMALSMIQKRQAEKESQLAERGSCGYGHKKPTVPDRRYWICTLDWQGNATPYEALNSPSAVVCKKHYAEADAWIEEQAAIMSRGNSSIKAVYTELT